MEYISLLVEYPLSISIGVDFGANLLPKFGSPTSMNILK